VADPEIRCALYLRVSTRDQRLLQQFRDLVVAVKARGWVVAKVYRERRSGAAGLDRPQWRALQHEADLRRFGAVAAVSLDRLGRSSLELLSAVDRLHKRGIRLLLLREGIASDEPVGHMLITVLAGVAQLERDLIGERTRAGIRAARARGVVLGRKRERVSDRDLDRLRSREVSYPALARELRTSVRTLRRRLRERDAVT